MFRQNFEGIVTIQTSSFRAERAGSCLVKLHFYEVINHSSVFRKVLSDLQLKAGKEEGNEKKSLHQLRKEREADREERIQVQPFPFLNLVYFGNHRNQ